MKFKNISKLYEKYNIAASLDAKSNIIRWIKDYKTNTSIVTKDRAPRCICYKSAIANIYALHNQHKNCKLMLLGVNNTILHAKVLSGNEVYETNIDISSKPDAFSDRKHELVTVDISADLTTDEVENLLLKTIQDNINLPGSR